VNSIQQFVNRSVAALQQQADHWKERTPARIRAHHGSLGGANQITFLLDATGAHSSSGDPSPLGRLVI
jgi:hypothetical protein